MNKVLKCFYDFSLAPASYDFFTFLISAELCRIRRGCDSIALYFVKGPNEGFREKSPRPYETNINFFHNVIIPGIAILPTCKKFYYLNRDEIKEINLIDQEIFPRGYSINSPVAEYKSHELVAASIRGDKPAKFKAPTYALKLVDSFFRKINTKKKIITLTTREIVQNDSNNKRAINKYAWKSIFSEAEKHNIFPIVIRDTNNMFDKEKLFSNVYELSSASLHLHFRLALYEKSFLNFIKGNGPEQLIKFGNCNAVYFYEFHEKFNATSSAWFKKNFGMIEGSNFPMTTQNFNYVWGQETVEKIESSFKYKFTKDQNKETNPINSKESLMASIEISLKHLIKCLSFSVLSEDIYLMYSIDNLNKKGLLVGNSIIEQLKNLQEQKIIPLNTIDKIMELDKKLNNQFK